MTGSTATPDYFTLLGLDPDAPWNQALFEQTLRERRQRWARESTSGLPDRRAAAKEYLKLVQTIQAELSDPGTRQRHAEAAKQNRAAGRQQLLARFAEDVRIRAAKGYLLETEIGELAKHYGAAFSEAEIRARATVPIQAAAPTPTVVVLEPSIRKDIRDQLAVVGKQDLYEFLTGLPSAQVDRERLETLAKAIYRETNANANKNDPILNARAGLAGHAQNIFKSDEQRAMYDATLREEVYEELLARVDQLGRSARMIYPGQVQLLLEDARKANLDVEEARTRIIERARKNQVTIEVVQLEVVSQQQRCGNCGELSPREAKRCTTCGEVLAAPCPRCNAETQASQRACGQCGFPVGNRAWVRALIEESRRLEAEGDLAEALTRATQAAEDWPATKPDEIADLVSARRHELEQRARERQELLATIDAMAADRRFFRVRQLILGLSDAARTGDAHLTSLLATANRAIAGAEAVLTDARGRGMHGEAAAAACQQALGICRDYEAARDLLRQTPPAPPATLVSSVRGSVVRLSWQGSASPGVQHVVVRKRQARPRSVDDGERIATLPGSQIDDAAPEIGVPLCYAVFADREGVPSIEAAHLPTPALVLAEVARLTAQVDDAQVLLRWQPPPNARRVFAVRAAGALAPASPSDGIRIEAPDARQVLDTRLVNERTYHYAIFCEFADHLGGMVTSSGVPISATPQIPPRPIAHLAVASVTRGAERKVEFDWEPPAKGEVRILCTSQPVDGADPVIPAGELARLGQSLIADRRPLLDDPPASGACYYTPVVVFAGSAYLGRSQRFVDVPEVGGLRAVNLGSVIQATWQWPPGCSEVQVSYANQDWPVLEATASGNGSAAPAGSQRVSRAQYDRDGHFTLRQARPSDYFFVVQAVTRQDGEILLSPGAAPGARAHLRTRSKVTLEYEIRKGFLGRKQQLVLKPNRAADVPTLLLMRKRGSLPINRNDGECALRLPGPQAVAGPWAVDVVGSAERQPVYAKLFLEDDGDYEAVTILHPALDKLKL